MSERAGLVRRFLACLYELLSLIAIWFFCAFVFVMLNGHIEIVVERLLLQITLWVISGIYLVVCWVKTGQTLAAQAWKIKLVNTDNTLLTYKKACIRYLLATMSLCFFGLGFLWAVVDKEHLFLHDRLSNTLLIKVPVQ
ncbi:MAG TPA: RDD family protein [Methylophilaceae bacterium]|nr:RDD family protein [Methylophilaceae bacterium]